jgi:hypothetical protein
MPVNHPKTASGSLGGSSRVHGERRELLVDPSCPSCDGVHVTKVAATTLSNQRLGDEAPSIVREPAAERRVSTSANQVDQPRDRAGRRNLVLARRVIERAAREHPYGHAAQLVDMTRYETPGTVMPTTGIESTTDDHRIVATESLGLTARLDVDVMITEFAQGRSDLVGEALGTSVFRAMSDQDAHIRFRLTAR